MNLARLSLSRLRAHRVNSILNLAVLALAIATIVVILLVSRQLEDRLARDAAGIDLVIGGKGSSTQLVLSAVYELDAPVGAISLSEAQRLITDAGVRTAIPVALADNYWGYRIVGTTPDYIAHYNAQLQDGRLWKGPNEAVIGADVAARMRAVVGTTFVPAHGVRNRDVLHDGIEYRVVGVLARSGTVLDRLVLTDVDSVAALHNPQPDPESPALVTEPPVEDPRAITALLVRAASADAAQALADKVNAQTSLQAVTPDAEIDRLFGFVGIGREAFWGFAILLMLTAAVSSFIALYDALSEHRQELAIMRVLGAGPAKLMALMLIEGLLLAAAGTLIGVVLGHVFTSALGLFFAQAQQAAVTGLAWYPVELWLLALAAAVGFGAAILPAWRARTVDIAAALAR